MEIALITGSCGLVGSEAARFFYSKGFSIVGIDNNMRQKFFGSYGSINWSRKKIEKEINNYDHYDIDIRNDSAIEHIFMKYGERIKLIVHAAAQPSHDWAATNPIMDFTINANGTLTMLEMTRRYCMNAVFIFISTNKVYGDLPNFLPFVELEKRWEIDQDHPFFNKGIDESMSVDQSKHSLFGVSKLSADIMVQEYGKYFGMKTGVFRCGCITGPSHSGVELHGFLAYLMKCSITGSPYRVFGYKAKQVRDNIHSFDLINALWSFYKEPKRSEVYNMGGGRFSNCSMLEAIEKCEEISGNKINWYYDEKNRIGDHIWWISDISKFKQHYPEWELQYNLDEIFRLTFYGIKERS